MENKVLQALPTVPLAIFLLPFAAGISFQKGLYGLGYMDIFALCCLILVCFIIFSLPLFNLQEARRHRSKWFAARRFLVLLGAFMLFFGAGIIHFANTYEFLAGSQAGLLELAEQGGRVKLIGYVKSVALPRGNSDARAMVFVKYVDIHGTDSAISQSVVVTFKNLSWDQLRPGQRLVFKARLYRIRNFGTPGSFDYENWWALRGISVRAVCSSPLDVLFLQDSSVQPGLVATVFLAVEQLRMKIIKNLLGSLPPRASSVAIALLTGSRAWFSQDQKMLYSSAGIGHLFAVSGLHMAMMAGLSVFLVGFVGRSIPWLLLRVNMIKISWIMAVFSCLFYCALAGGSPSSLRAFIMIASLAFCFISGRKSCLEAGLFLAAWLLLLKTPFYLFDVSFQLSFTVVFFLIFWGRYFSQTVPFAKGPVWTFALVCLLAFAASSPLVVFYFHRLNPFAIFLNLLCIPIAQFLVLPNLFLASFFSLVAPSLGSACFTLVSLGISAMNRLAVFFTDPLWMNHFVLPPRPWELFIMILLFFLAPLAWRSGKLGCAFVFFAVLLVCGHLFQDHLKNHRKGITLHVLDVGQGLCQVLELPKGQVLVADTGGFKGSRFDVGDRVVAPYLRRLGIRYIDILAISHPDTDHIGGALSLVRQFKIGQVWVNNVGGGSGTQLFNEFLALVHRRNIPVRAFEKTSSVRLQGRVVVECFVAKKKQYLSKNDMGLVFRVIHPGGNMLLPGDIQKRREMALLMAGAELRSQVIVVPHHGAKGSSSYSFLQSVCPNVAVVSCGYKNPFHHPAPAVLQRYRSLGVKVLRTDVDGTIDIKIAGNHKIKVSGYYRKGDLLFNPESI